MTPEQIALAWIGDEETIDKIRHADTFWIESEVTRLIRAAVQVEREACAAIVMKGGDGIDRLETAITYGANAALAQAILERKTP